MNGSRSIWRSCAFLVLALSLTLVAQAPPQPNGTDPVALVGSLPICGQTCITATFAACECRLRDFNCFCGCSDVPARVTDCTDFRCTAPGFNETVLAAMGGVCPKPVPVQTVITTSTTSRTSTTTTLVYVTTPPSPNGTCAGVRGSNTTSSCPAHVTVSAASRVPVGGGGALKWSLWLAGFMATMLFG